MCVGNPLDRGSLHLLMFARLPANVIGLAKVRCLGKWTFSEMDTCTQEACGEYPLGG